MSAQLTFLSEEPPANPSRSPASASEWMTRVATWPLNFVRLLADFSPASWSGKTSLGYIPPGPVRRSVTTSKGTKTVTSGHSSTPWRSAGIRHAGESWTLNMSEWTHTLVPSHSDGSVSSLSDILETGDHLRPYYLSPRACAGILRRAAKRDKTLPAALERALSAVAGELADEKPQPII